MSIYDLTWALLQLDEMPVIVIHEIFQRNPVVAWLLRPFGLIWKQVDLHDGKSIRQMKRAAKAGRSILLYPEGDLTWSGDTGELPDSIIKLIRYVGLPVVVLTEKGAYMTYSRWAGSVRKGLVELDFKCCISLEELKGMDDPQLLLKLKESFRHSECSWVKEMGPALSFAGNRQAKDLSKMLFLCPNCESAQHMVNSDVCLSCSNCGFAKAVGSHMELSRDEPDGPCFSDIWEWHRWQTDKWKQMVSEKLLAGDFHLSASLRKAELVRAIGAIKRIVSRAGFHSRLLKRPEKAKAAKAAISEEGLRISAEDGRELLFIPIGDMLSVRVLPMRVYRPNWLLISTPEGYYKLMFEGPEHPAYSWCSALRLIIGQEDACPLLEDSNGSP